MTAKSGQSSEGHLSGDWVTIGRIVGTFGVHGELKVELLTDIPDRFAQLATVYLGDYHTPHRVERAHPHKRLVLLQLEGVPDLTAAERLRGERLSIPAAELALLPADQYYIDDLIGMRVQHVNGMPLGRVADVLRGGGNDLLLVRETPSGQDVLLPAVKAFIKSVDVAGGVLHVEPIPGIFDDQAELADE